MISGPKAAATLRALVTGIGLIVIWAAIVEITGVPPFILPGPDRVLASWIDHLPMLMKHGAITGIEIGLGLVIGCLLGCASALAMARFISLRRWLMPVLIVSQAVPVFALAPLLTLWLGYGIASKVTMAVLIIFFPVTATFLDGLRRAELGWLDLARVMGADRWAVLLRIRLPAALPALASGIRVAAAVAPIGAVVGEWVGASQGLGYLMLHAIGRVQIDLVFAALFTLALLAISLYAVVDKGLRIALPWLHESQEGE